MVITCLLLLAFLQTNGEVENLYGPPNQLGESLERDVPSFDDPSPSPTPTPAEPLVTKPQPAVVQPPEELPPVQGIQGVNEEKRDSSMQLEHPQAASSLTQEFLIHPESIHQWSDGSPDIREPSSSVLDFRIEDGNCQYPRDRELLAPAPITAETTLGEDWFLDQRTGIAALHVDVPYDADLFIEYAPTSGAPGIVSQSQIHELRSRGGHRHFLLRDMPTRARIRVRVTARVLREDMERTRPHRTQYVRLMAGDRKHLTFHAKDFVIQEDWRLYAPIEYVAAEDNVGPPDEEEAAHGSEPTTPTNSQPADPTPPIPPITVSPPATAGSEDGQLSVPAEPKANKIKKESVDITSGRDIRMSVAIPAEDLHTKPLSVRGEYKLDVFPYEKAEGE